MEQVRHSKRWPFKWGSSRRALARAALVAAVLVLPYATNAQGVGSDTANAEGRAAILEQGSFIKVDDLDFGTIAQPVAAGTVVLTPTAAATCNTTGGLIHSDECRAASFAGDISFLFILRITRPPGNQITLTGPGGATMRVSNFTFGPGSALLNLGSTATEQRYLVLTGNGFFRFYVGGTLNVGANQATGSYTGSFPIQVNYN